MAPESGREQQRGRPESDLLDPPARWPLLLVLLSVVLQAAVQGTITTTIRPADSLLFTTLSFGLATLVFLPLSRRRSRNARRAKTAPARTLGAQPQPMIAMNVATAVTFLSFYLSISLIDAATASAIEVTVGPVALIILLPHVLGHADPLTGRRRILVALLTLLGVALAWHTFELTSTDSGTGAALAGLALATTAGVGMASISLISRRFGEHGISPVTVTAHRFHLTYLLAAALWLLSGPSAPSPGTVATYAALGSIAVVVPLFLLQVGFQRADPLAGITILAVLPGVTYLVQLANGSAVQPATIALLGAIMLVATVQSRSPAPARLPRVN